MYPRSLPAISGRLSFCTLREAATRDDSCTNAELYGGPHETHCRFHLFRSDNQGAPCKDA